MVLCHFESKFSSVVVLIFEKSRDLAKRLIDLIKEAGREWHIFHAYTFTDAGMLLQITDPNVILMDLHFSKNPSLSLLQLAKRKDNKIVVIMMYTDASEHNLQQCLLLGADHLLNKYDDFSKIPGIISGLENDKIEVIK